MKFSQLKNTAARFFHPKKPSDMTTEELFEQGDSHFVSIYKNAFDAACAFVIGTDGTVSAATASVIGSPMAGTLVTTAFIVSGVSYGLTAGKNAVQSGLISLELNKRKDIPPPVPGMKA